MIRVNLLKNRSDTSRTAVTGDVKLDGSYQTVEDGGSNTRFAPDISLLFKILMMGIGVVGLLVYESYNVGQLQAILKSENNKKMTLTKQIQERKPVAGTAKVLQKNILDIEARINAIKDLSKFRLREIKAIDYIQNNIPERVWINKIDFQDAKVFMEGGSLTDDELNKFIELLEGRSAFKNVILVRAQEEKKKEGTVKYFQVISDLVSPE